MNIIVSQNSVLMEGNHINTFLEFIYKIPLTELLVGVVVPILSALISYIFDIHAYFY